MAIVYCCGWECQQGATIAGLASTAHWNAPTGTPAISTSVKANGGTASMLIDTTGGAASVYASRTVVAGTRNLAFRFYLRIETAPSGNANIFSALTSPCHISITSGRVIRAQASTGTVVTGPTLNLNQWYRIEGFFDVDSSTFTVDWQVDGSAQTQATGAGTAADISAFRIGMNAALTGKMYFDDLVLGNASGDYPIGSGETILSELVSTGTHGGTGLTLGDFQDEASTNIAINGSDTTSHQKLDEVPAGTSDFVKQVVIRTTGYVEYKYRTQSRIPRAVEQIVYVHNTSTNDSSQKAQLYDGTTASDTTATTFVGNTTSQKQYSKQWATPPSGGSWTSALFDLLRLRWGFGGDVTTPPALDASYLEADFPLGGGATNAPAEATSGTGTAGSLGKSLGPTSAASSGTGTANAPGKTLAGSSQASSATGTAAAPGRTLAVNVAASSGTGTAGQPTVTKAVSAAAGAASGTGTAAAPGINTSSNVPANAEAASGTAGSGTAARAHVAPGPTAASGFGIAAIAVGADLNVIAGVPSGTGTAMNASVVATELTNAGVASGVAGTGTAARGSVAVNAPASSGTGTALDASVAVLAFVNAAAIPASGTGAANDALPSVAPRAATTSGTGTALGLVTLIEVGGVQAAEGSGTAPGALAGQSTYVLTTQAASGAAGAGTAARGSVSVSAQSASGTGTAANAARLSIAPRINAASGTGTAPNQAVLAGKTASANAASGTGTAATVKATVAPRNGVASGTGSGYDADTAIFQPILAGYVGLSDLPTAGATISDTPTAGLSGVDLAVAGLTLTHTGDLDMGTYDIGDGITLTGAFTNEAGAATNPTSVQATLKTPDKEVNTLVTTNPQVGTYRAVIVAQQPGRHYFRFAGTGAVVAAQESSFRVRKQKTI